MTKKRRVYTAKTLFDGMKAIGKEGLYVGVPGGQQYETIANYSKVKNFYVEHNGERMLIENWHKADGFRKFDDMQGRGTYTLAYFKWNPEPKEDYAHKAFMEDMLN